MGQVPAQRGAGAVGSVGVAGRSVWAGLSGAAAPEAASPAVWDEREEDTQGSEDIGGKWVVRHDRGPAWRSRRQAESDHAVKNVTPTGHLS